MKKLLLATVAASLLVPASLVVAYDFAKHPHLRAADTSINQAIEELKRADDGAKKYGGHRDKAEQMLHEALRQINEAAGYADAHPGPK